MNVMGGSKDDPMSNDGVSGLLSGLGQMNNMGLDNTEINKLKAELSSNTNVILQL